MQHVSVSNCQAGFLHGALILEELINFFIKFTLKQYLQ